MGIGKLQFQEFSSILSPFMFVFQNVDGNQFGARFELKIASMTHNKFPCRLFTSFYFTKNRKFLKSHAYPWTWRKTILPRQVNIFWAKTSLLNGWNPVGIRLANSVPIAALFNTKRKFSAPLSRQGLILYYIKQISFETDIIIDTNTAIQNTL